MNRHDGARGAFGRYQSFRQLQGLLTDKRCADYTYTTVVAILIPCPERLKITTPVDLYIEYHTMRNIGMLTGDVTPEDVGQTLLNISNDRPIWGREIKCSQLQRLAMQCEFHSNRYALILPIMIISLCSVKPVARKKLCFVET